MGKRTHGPYLIAAIEYSDIEKVSHILTTKFRDKAKVKTFLTSEVRRLASEYTEVPLMLAATLSDPTIIRYFVTKHDVNVNFVYEYGAPNQRRRKTALLVAVRRGNYATVDALLSLNADANSADHKLRTALHHAVRRADYRMAKLLLARGALASPCDASGNTALHVASIFGHAEMCRLLLRHSADLYKKGMLGALPIHMAAREGHAALVKMFVTLYEVNGDIRVPCYGDREQAPIHVAAAQGHHETVFTLLEQCGADVNAQDSEGETPLHCSVVNEYDPLGMKFKDDYTETAKILLNFGAEVNVRNARGETPLHLAARNEFQKVVEVLILAGSDPMIEDNDKNKPIDLVAEDDAVSRQTLKNALMDRDRLFNESREIRAKGFSTSLQRELPLSMRSQSTMNVQLLAGMHGAAAANRYTSHTGLFQPNLSMQYPPTFSGGLSGGPMNMSLGYIPGAVGMAHYAGPGVGSGGGGGGNQSGSRTGSSSNGSWNHQPRLPDSMMHGAVSAVALADHPPRGPPMAALRKVRSVEELDQPRGKKDAASKAAASRRRRVRKSSYQESETSSFWAVTPPGSVHDDEEDGGDDRSALDIKIPPLKSGKQLQVPVPAAAAKKAKKTTKQKERLNEDDEERGQPVVDNRQKEPLLFMSAKKAAAMQLEHDGNQSDDYFLDDDSSVDDLDLDESRHKKRDKKTKRVDVKQQQQQRQQPVVAARQVITKGEPAVKKKAVESWVDEQARILKERNSAPEAEKPVAHSTPPASKKGKKHGGDKKKKKTKKKRRSDSDDSESETSSSSETETTETDSDSSSNAPKVAPPPPPATKPKPQPLPKPSSSKDGNSGKTGPPPTQRKISGGTTRQQPLFQMEQAGCDHIVKVDVDDSTETGETIISIIPLQPPGPTRVQKIPAGAETSTYLSLSRPMTPKTADDSFSKKSMSKKSPTPPPSDGKTSQNKRDDDGRKGAVEVPRPVPKPRESKQPTSSNVTGGSGERKASDSSQKKEKKKSKKSTVSDSESVSSTDFSDEDHEEAAALAAAAASKLKSTVRPTPAPTKQQPSSADRQSPFTKQPPVKSITQPQQLHKPGNVSAAKLIFEKAGTESTPDASISFADVSTSSTAGATSAGGKVAAGMNSQPKASTDRVGQIQGAAAIKEKPLVNAKPRQNTEQIPVSAPRQVQQSKNDSHSRSSSSSSGSEDDSDEDDGAQRTDDFRTVTYRSENQSVCFTLVGGNVKGVFVEAVDATSDPARAGLRIGDQLLCVNGRPVFGSTREEVMQLVRSSVGSTTVLLVRHRPNLCRTIAETNSGSGDSFTVRSHFIYDASRRGELTVHDGDVFAVTDTLPDGNAGFWRARKVDFAGRKDDDGSTIGNGGTSAEGLIPNRSKADQIVMRDMLAQGKSTQNNRGTAFFRSFRRSKSVGRINGGSEEDDSAGGDGRNSTNGLSDVVSYERVVQKVAEVRRPVIVLGLFCDTVRGMLVSEASGKFVAPPGEVEIQTKNATSGSTDMSVDVRPIVAASPSEHCVLILSPPAIEYLRQRTDLNPIVVYISPVSKTVVKVVKSKLAPTYNKNPGFMYDEAARFEKNYAHLFSAVVPYTIDDTWYHNLRDAIDYLQNQPTWVSVPPADLEANAEAEAAKVLPPRALKSAAETAALRSGTGTGKTTGKPSGARPVSRTTDDLPNEYRSQQVAGGGAGTTGSTGGSLRKTDNLVSQRSVDVSLNGSTKDVNRGTGSTGGTLRSVPVKPTNESGQGRTETALNTDKPQSMAAVPAKSRNQSTSSTLDRQPPQQPLSTPPVAILPGISGVNARPRVVAVSQSHETQL